MKNLSLEKINDVYFISEQIKKINKDFNLFFNKNSGFYEIHNFNYNPSLIVTYKNYPDFKLVEKLYKTNKENMQKTILEIDEQNQKLERYKESILIDKATNSISEILNYSIKNPGKEITSNQIKNILN